MDATHLLPTVLYDPSLLSVSLMPSSGRPQVTQADITALKLTFVASHLLYGFGLLSPLPGQSRAGCGALLASSLSAVSDYLLIKCSEYAETKDYGKIPNKVSQIGH